MLVDACDHKAFELAAKTECTEQQKRKIYTGEINRDFSVLSEA